MKFLQNLFKKKNTDKQEALQYAEKAFEYSLDALKESRSNGHPCPDYALKENYEKLALKYTLLAKEKKQELHCDIQRGLDFIVDANRLKSQNKPFPINFFQVAIEDALHAVLENKQ